MMKVIIPKIKISDALKTVNGNQSKLAGILGYKRAYINNLVKSDAEFFPENPAWRFNSIKDDLEYLGET